MKIRLVIGIILLSGIYSSSHAQESKHSSWYITEDNAFKTPQLDSLICDALIRVYNHDKIHLEIFFPNEYTEYPKGENLDITGVFGFFKITPELEALGLNLINIEKIKNRRVKEAFGVKFFSGIVLDGNKLSFYFTSANVIPEGCRSILERGEGGKSVTYCYSSETKKWDFVTIHYF